jgi:hypothetical protein
MTDSTDRTLARIECALENWERGPDVMQWTPRLRSPAEREAGSAEQIERMHEALRPLVAAFAGLRAGAEQAMRQLTAELDVMRAHFTLTPGEPEQSCHCLCLHNHKGRELCQGNVPVSAVEILRRHTTSLGPVDVPMCPPCADASLAVAT